MAIEIKRSPVLEGDAAKAFNQSLQNNPQVSEVRVRTAIQESKKILELLKAKSR